MSINETDSCCVQKRAYKLEEWDGPMDFLEQVARGAGVFQNTCNSALLNTTRNTMSYPCIPVTIPVKTDALLVRSVLHVISSQPYFQLPPLAPHFLAV